MRLPHIYFGKLKRITFRVETDGFLGDPDEFELDRPGTHPSCFDKLLVAMIKPKIETSFHSGLFNKCHTLHIAHYFCAELVLIDRPGLQLQNLRPQTELSACSPFSAPLNPESLCLLQHRLAPIVKSHFLPSN